MGSGVDGGAIRAHLRGDLHTHSDWSDGGARSRRWRGRRASSAMTTRPHGPLAPAHGRQRLTPARLHRQLDVVAEINERLAPFRILTGIEVDILDDGALDQSDELLARLDVVVGVGALQAAHGAPP